MADRARQVFRHSCVKGVSKQQPNSVFPPVDVVWMLFGILPLTSPLGVFCTLKNGVFLSKEVFPIGISLCGPIRGTRSDGKLNLIYKYKYNIAI